MMRLNAVAEEMYNMKIIFSMSVFNCKRKRDVFISRVCAYLLNLPCPEPEPSKLGLLVSRLEQKHIRWLHVHGVKQNFLVRFEISSSSSPREQNIYNNNASAAAARKSAIAAAGHKWPRAIPTRSNLTAPHAGSCFN